MPQTPESQLDEFLDRFTPEVAKSARLALAALRKLVPGATELVYDNYNALAIGFAPGERVSDAVFSIALYPQWVSLFFLKGVGLPDPKKRLQGNGKVVRHVVLETPDVLKDPDILDLIRRELVRAVPSIDPKGKRRLIIKSVSPKQRPRRPAEKVVAAKKPAPKKAVVRKAKPTKK